MSPLEPGPGSATTPSEHRTIGLRVARDVSEHPAVHAVLLGGSVARGEEQPSSDVDLLVVGDQPVVALRRVIDGVLVECISHSEPEWAGRFDRPRTSWLYAFSEAETVHDDGAGARLRSLAAQTRASYRAADALRSLLATRLWHGQAKLDRVRSDDTHAQGFWAAICIETILDGLFTIHDVPLPAGARRLAYLADVPLTPTERDLLDQYLTGSVQQRFDATVRLSRHLRARLGPADHETARAADGPAAGGP